jgi:hypothetical protein
VVVLSCAELTSVLSYQCVSLSGDRWSADHYLTSWPRQLFPQHFADVLHPFFSSLLPLDADARLAAVAGRFKQLAAAVAGAEEASPGSGSGGQGQQPVAVRVSSRAGLRLLCPVFEADV